MHLFLLVKHFSRWDVAGRSCNKNKGRAIGGMLRSQFRCSRQHIGGGFWTACTCVRLNKQHAQVCSQSTNTKLAYLLKAGSVKTTFGRSSGDNELATRFCALDAPQVLYINVRSVCQLRWCRLQIQMHFEKLDKLAAEQTNFGSTRLKSQSYLASELLTDTESKRPGKMRRLT